jgi:hypothetical protein
MPLLHQLFEQKAWLVVLRGFKIPSQPGCGNFSKHDYRKGLKPLKIWDVLFDNSVSYVSNCHSEKLQNFRRYYNLHVIAHHPLVRNGHLKVCSF